VWGSAAAAALVCSAYVWQVRPIFAEGLPFDPRWTSWMRFLRLLPAP
jgi:hypothetical protein